MDLDKVKTHEYTGREIAMLEYMGEVFWKGFETYQKYESYEEFTWRKYNRVSYYRWSRYNIAQVVVGYERSSGMNATGSYEWSIPSIYEDWSINSSTGAFSVSNRVYFSRGAKGYHIEGGYLYYAEVFLTVRDEELALRNVTRYYAREILGDGKGSFVDNVTSSNYSTYPNGGKSGSYWYDNRTTLYRRGTYIENVKSTNASAYPTSGSSGSYWYDTRTSEWLRGNYVAEVEADDGTYPENGRHTDGFWYVKIS